MRTVEGCITATGTAYNQALVKPYNKSCFSSCRFIDSTLTTENFISEDVIFKSCTFYNTRLMDVAFNGDKFIDCTFFASKLESIHFANMLISNVTFNNCSFNNIVWYKTKLYNSIISENRELKTFRMNSCSIIGGSIPPSIMSRIDLLNTKFESINDIFQSPDVEKTVPDYTISIADTKETYVKVPKKSSSKPYLFLSEGM